MTKPTLSHESHVALQSTTLCPNCHTSLMLCPCRLVPHGVTGMRALDPEHYFQWRVARFEKRFGTSYTKACKHPPQQPSVRRALRKLELIHRKAETWAVHRDSFRITT